MDYYLGMIFLWGGPWIPVGFMPCDGRSLNIQQYAALYAIMGTRYGGNGTSTFNLPDLRSRFPLGLPSVGQPPLPNGGSTAYTGNLASLGSVSIGVSNLPTHNHSYNTAPSGTVSIAIPVSTAAPANTNTPGTNTILGAANFTDGVNSQDVAAYSTATSGAGVTTLAPFNATLTGGGAQASTGSTGSGTALPINVVGALNIPTMPPYCSVNYMICVQGLFPPRN